MPCQFSTALPGLIVLKKLVEFYGGMIQIISRDEDGVRVTIMFEATKKE